MHAHDYIRMPWGKYRGCSLANVPTSYLCWVLEECDNLDPYLRRGVLSAIADRLGLTCGEPTRPPCARCSRLAQEWQTIYSRLARAIHPDRGGSTPAMQFLVDANETFRGG